MTGAWRSAAGAVRRELRESSVIERALWMAIVAVAAVRLKQAIPFGGDLRIIWFAGRHLLDGDPVFADPYFIYLPSSALFAAPFGLLPEDVGVGVGAVLGCLAVIAFAWAAVRLLAAPAPRWLAPAVALAVLVSHAGGDLITVANSEFVTLAMLPFILLSAARGRWVLFGVLLGVSIAVKPFLLALLALPLLAGRFRALAIAIGIPVAVSLLTLPFVADPGAFFGTTIPNLLQGQDALNNTANASLANLLEYVGVPERLALLLRLLLVVVGLTAALLRWRRPGGDPVVRVVEVGTLLLLTSSLASSVVWSHYSLLALPVFVIAGRAGAVTGRTAVLWPLLLPVFALGYPASMPGVWGTVMVRVGVALVLILLVLSWRAARSQPAAAEPAAGHRDGHRTDGDRDRNGRGWAATAAGRRPVRAE